MSEIQGKPVYGTCDCKERRQVLSVEQTTDLIQQMASNEWQVPADYIPKTSVNGIIEQHNGDEVKLWIGTQAEYDALTEEEKAYYLPIISDDPTYQEIMNKIKSLNESVENVNARLDKLGFKEDDIVDLDNNIVGKVSRQGNYVIGTLYSNFNSSRFGTLPEEYRPKTNATFGAFSQFYLQFAGNSGGAFLSEYNTGGYSARYTISTDGKISLSSERMTINAQYNSSNQITANTYPTNVSGCNFGYEANPIE